MIILLLFLYNPSIRLFSLLRIGCWLQNLERAHQCIIYGHHCTGIIKFPTIVWCRKYGHQFSPCKEFISILYNLMGSDNKIKIVFIQKFFHDLWSECERDSSIIVLIGLRENTISLARKVSKLLEMEKENANNDLLHLMHQDLPTTNHKGDRHPARHKVFWYRWFVPVSVIQGSNLHAYR